MLTPNESNRLKKYYKEIQNKKELFINSAFFNFGCDKINRVEVAQFWEHYCITRQTHEVTMTDNFKSWVEPTNTLIPTLRVDQTTNECTLTLASASTSVEHMEKDLKVLLIANTQVIYSRGYGMRIVLDYRPDNNVPKKQSRLLLEAVNFFHIDITDLDEAQLVGRYNSINKALKEAKKYVKDGLTTHGKLKPLMAYSFSSFPPVTQVDPHDFTEEYITNENH